MRKVILLILFAFLGCDQQVRIEPDYSKHWKGQTTADYAWVYHVEKRISDQLYEKGFIEVDYKEPNDVIAYGIRGTWTKDDDYWSTECLYLRAHDPEIALKNLNEAIYGNLEFNPVFRRATWFYCWSYKNNERAKKIRDDLIEQYLEKMHKKFEN